MKKYFAIGLCLLIHQFLHGNEFFKKENLFETGVYYYPEAWPTAQWERDFKNMASMGFEFTHFGEFAWAFMEPSEGTFDFKWLDSAIYLAYKSGLKVILCTPSPTPPVWLTRKYPEVLVVKDNGIKASHGTRQHCSWSSEKYRELVSIIVSKLAERYGTDSRIWGWQIDNEPSHYGTIDYGPSVLVNFKLWLQKKYGTIEKLNNAWGASFWSGVYNSFDEIELPNPQRLISGPASPHALLDFKRFSADECADFVSMQYNIIKKHSLSSQWVTTNFMHEFDQVNPWLNHNLDILSYTVYPVAGYTSGTGENGFRMGDWWRIPWSNDFFKSINGTAGVMELQPGQVNWGSYNPQPLPGVIRAWLWSVFSGDSKFVCSYRFRQPLSGNEQYHYGMVGTDGVTPTPGGLEYSQFIREVKEIRKYYRKDSLNPKDYEARRVGFMFSFDNLWNQQINAQTYQWNYFKHQVKYYAILKSLNCPINFIDSLSDFSKYKIIVAPAYQMVNENLCKKWLQYVQAGGNLILTCRSGQKDYNGHFYETLWTDKISELIGGRIEYFDLLADNVWGKVTFANKVYKWNNWAEILRINQNTEPLAFYSDQFYKDRAATSFHRIGKGSVLYIGTDTDEGLLEKELIKEAFNKFKVSTVELPESLVLDYRDGFGIAINYNSIPADISRQIQGELIIGDRVLNPAGVAVWKAE